MTNNEIIQQFKDWVSSHLTPPRPQFGGLPICPFAKVTVLKDTVEIYTISSDSIDSFYQVTLHYCLGDWMGKEILIFINKEKYSNQYLESIQERLNAFFNFYKYDLIAFKDHPDDPVIIDGINTSFPYYPFIMVQKRKNIDEAHEELKKTDYYSKWSKQNLNDVVNWRL